MKSKIGPLLFKLGIAFIVVGIFDDFLFDTGKSLLDERLSAHRIYKDLIGAFLNTFYGFCLIGISRLIEVAEAQNQLFSALRKRQT